MTLSEFCTEVTHLETPPPPFADCVCECAFVHVRARNSFLSNILSFHTFFFLKRGLERAEPVRGGDLRVALRGEGSRGCRRGRLRLWAKAEHRQGLGLRDPATASRPGVRGGALM